MGKIKHGMSKRKRVKDGKRLPAEPEYRAYMAMKNRCLNPNQSRFKDYGARGITICERWINGENGLTGFECFIADMGFKPVGSTLDRIENDLGYNPSNCRWATRIEQARNTRSNRIVIIDGGSMTLADAVDAYGAVSYSTAVMRLHRGWSDEDAIKTPVSTGKRYRGDQKHMNDLKLKETVLE